MDSYLLSHDPLNTWSCEIKWQTKTTVSPLYRGYGHQIWQDGNLPWWAPGYKFMWPYDHMTKIISPLPLPMATKLGRMVVYFDELLPIKSHDPLNTWSYKITWWTKIISSLSLRIVTKYGKMVIYLNEFLPIKSHDPLIIWSCKITWQTKIILPLLSQCLWPPSLVRW